MAADRSPIRVVGRYALYNEIAAGGMATIHLGRLLGPVGFARTVAVKRLHPQFAKDPEFVSMFLDEARLAARVQHPNVVATIDVVATDGELFLIMDYVRGESLSKILRAAREEGRRVPPRIAAAIICGFLHGLHAAHEAKNERGEPLGLVHRDVSPQNVLVGSDGIARVLDFGIAKAQGRIQVTRDGQIKGKLAYMPPEQLAGKELSRAVDIYASAVVMWETLTTERLFKGETESETLAKILRDPVLPPSTFAPNLPDGLDASLLRALSRDSTKRHGTAKELALELERCIGVASPTEVGEWIEHLVGPVLTAREDQIAEIESNSAGLRVSNAARAGLPEGTESDTDMSLPSSRAILAAAYRNDTPPMGSGPPRALSQHRIVVSSQAKGANPQARYGSEYPTGTDASKSRSGTLLTGSMLMLPVDRKLPVIASALGILVLVVVVAFVVAGKFSNEAGAKPAPSAAPPSSIGVVTSADPAATSSERAAPDAPAPSDSSIGEPPPGEPRLAASHPRSPAPVAHPPARTSVPKPSVGATSSPPAARKNCDPPYVIDAQGRRKYKLDCM
jgi:eukaryotic-like serine/threonine-protein kinase